MAKNSEDRDGQKRSLKNVKWVSHYLGVSRNTVHQWVLDGHIPYINLGVDGGRKIIRFDPEAIETWLIERTRVPAPKTESSENRVENTDLDD